MTDTVTVRDLASARCGDKGNTLNAVVVARDDAGYEFLADRLTAARVREAFDGLVEGPVTRYELPQLRAFNFVLEGALDGGVTRSLRADPHGKSLSYVVLGIELEVPDDVDVGSR